MPRLRYNICSPIRILIPLGLTSLAVPIIFKELFLNYIYLPIFYFVGSYFVFVNFPIIGETLRKKPLYLEDLIIKIELITSFL